LDTPQLVPDVQQGDIKDVSVSDTNLQGNMGRSFTYSTGALQPGKPVHFHATAESAKYHWVFGDGSTAEGRDVDHAFPDSQGSVLDGSGRFRVILRYEDENGKVRWDGRALMLANN